jgi:hypothetical protein
MNFNSGQCVTDGLLDMDMLLVLQAAARDPEDIQSIPTYGFECEWCEIVWFWIAATTRY